MRGMWRSCLLIGCAVMMSSSALLADVTGSILGTVTDPSSAAIQGVRIIATNLDTNLVTETKTDSVGEYRILSLPVGRYSLQADYSGFQTFVETGIIVTVNEQRRVDIVLKVGATKQEVISVNANAVQVETTNTQLGDVIDEKKILALPLLGRSYIDLLGLQPGVAPGVSPGNPGNQGRGSISVNGQREQGNGFLLNGSDVSGGANFEARIEPNVDSIREFRLITNSFDAEYGRFSGAVLNAITKSGTNSIHGTVFEFLRNDAADARSFFDGKKGSLKKNQYGYAVGGRAIKDKLFWFTDYQGDRQVKGGPPGPANVITVLSMAERQGNVGVANLTGLVTGSYWAGVLSNRLGYAVTNGEAYSFPGCATTGPNPCVFPNGIIPTSAFSPAATGTIGFIPTPPVGNTISVSASASIFSIDHKAGQRVDFLNKLTGNWSGYYSLDDFSSLDPFGGSSFPSGFGSEARNRDQLVTLSNTHIFSPTAVNDFHLSYTRLVERSVPAGNLPPSLASLGFKSGAGGGLGIINAGPAGYAAVPGISLGGIGTSFGDPGTSNAIQNTYQIGDNFSKVLGRHTMKLGGEYRYYQLNNRNGGNFVGSFSFDGTETGSDVADYLLGAPANYFQANANVLDGRSRYGGAFAQDSIRIRSDLTLNLGLRWEFSTPWYDTQNKIQTLVPGLQSVQYPGAPRGLVYPGDPGVPNTLAPTRYNNFAPRFGIAYSPSASEGFLGKLFGGPGKTSIRMGSGIFYNAIQDRTLYDIIAGIPFADAYASLVPPLFEEPFRNRSDGASQGQRFPYVAPAPGSPAARNFDFTPFLPQASVFGYNIHNKLPYGMHYNLTIQRQLSASMVFSVGYVGTLGRHLLAIEEANPADPALCLSLAASGATPTCGRGQEDQTFTRPDGTQVFGTRHGPFGDSRTFGSLFSQKQAANSDYNSLQASLEKRAGNSAFLFGYTWSKSLDNSSFYNNRLNYENPALGRGLSNFDVTHNFIASYTYTIPFEKAFPGFPKRLVRGWEIAGITRFSTGFPVVVLSAFDQSLRGTRGLDTANFTGSIQYADPRKADALGRHFFFTSQGFSLPAPGSFGNAPFRFFHGPGINNWNLALHKDTTIREGLTLQIRAEFFNAFNHAQFATPGIFPGGVLSFNGLPGPANFNSRFGLINAVQVPGRIGQIAAKFIF